MTWDRKNAFEGQPTHASKHQMTKRTITRMTLTIERIEVIHPSSAPFPAARRVVNTTGVEVRDSELPPRPTHARPIARVVALRRAG